MIEGIKEQPSLSHNMAEITKMEGALIVNQPMLIVPRVVVDTAESLQRDILTTAQYLENCYLIYRDCTINHVISGIALQKKDDGFYQWLTPSDFSWSDIDKVDEFAKLVRVQEADKSYRETNNSFSVHDINTGRLLYWQERPSLDTQIRFFTPSNLAFVDAVDWTRDMSRYLYRPALEIKKFLNGDESLENEGRQFLREMVENLRCFIPC